MESNKRLRVGSDAEDESSIGGITSPKDESKIGSGDPQSGQGSRSTSGKLVVGGVSVDSTEFGEIFENASFAERVLYCIPNDIGEVDLDIVSKLYDLVMSQLYKETDGNIASKAQKLLDLPRKCLDPTKNEIWRNKIFPISENSKKRISQASKAMVIIFEGLHEDKHRIDLALVMEMMSMFWNCRKGLEVLPEQYHITAEAIRSVRMAIVKFIGAALENKSGQEAVCSVMIPLVSHYNAEHDHDLLPLFYQVLNENEELIHNSRLLDGILSSSFQPIEVNHSFLKFSTNMCDLIEILWGKYYDDISNIQSLWKKVMSWTFWALRHENIEIAERASNILISVLNFLEGSAFNGNKGSSYILDLVSDVFLGFSKNQNPSIFNLHVELAFKTLSLTRQTNQELNVVLEKIVDSFKISCHYTSSDEIDNLVSNVIASQNVDTLKECLDRFFQEGGSTLSDLMKG